MSARVDVPKKMQGPPSFKKSVCLDFDGVMNTYHKWAGPDELYLPRPGLEEFLQQLSKEYDVLIHSTRESQKIEAWLEHHGLKKYVLRVTDSKPPAHVYLDDRAVCFDGSYHRALADIKKFKTHWEPHE